MKTRTDIEATATIGFGGIDWKATACAEVDGNEYLTPDQVDIEPVREGVNGGWQGDSITVDFGELPDSAQLAIEMELGRALTDFLTGGEL